ncbi:MULTISPECIES: inositol monophosphatase family protein [Streptomyces]|uniref:Inositol-1-monophosphatase n=1 Tax=Streptomyces fradiae ATCC 10745 = DSM 40063 TaxID=1319510 RepID=A0A1Y2NVB4_STRFR|nr:MULTISPECIES: inositol monophosphatase family protein [Streptomyces]KAF0648746.1 inositol-phosphate phosphatase [Streptomyces fradiae ATCC 10745 = DSM 40063]OSY51473.1 Inositol-1-monophosphatase [Streptomyces fradiae ATCC 10745 = DSM 40063]
MTDQPPPTPGPAGEPPLEELLSVALEAARRAGALLRDGRPVDLGVAATKSSPIDVVTEMDIAAEKLITDHLAEHRPHDGLLGEEGGASEGTSGIRWVVDPLDGTVNYLYGLPTWAVSIAAERDGEALVGVVEVPLRGETFQAVRGRGAWLGERRLRCRPAPQLDRALIATGFNYVTTVRAHQAEVAHRLLPLVRDVRRSGSAAVDLADVAAGRLDGYYERGLRPWDRAAGALIAREAGALTGGRPGGREDDALTVAAPPGVFEPLQALLEDFGAWHD